MRHCPDKLTSVRNNISSAPRDAPALLAVDRRRGRVLLLGAADAKSVSLFLPDFSPGANALKVVFHVS